METNLIKDFETYGEGEFFVEFSRWPGKSLTYQLFKRNYKHSKSEMELLMKDCETENERFWMESQNEYHPYQLLSGEVNEHLGVICFETKGFLKFTIDSLNKNYETGKP